MRPVKTRLSACSVASLTVFDVDREYREVKSLMSDMPYGDPFSGTPYGQYHKSKGVGMVLGVVMSVVTMGAALPMMASTVLATQIAGGVMMAGGVLSGVGAISGNKKLSKIGGVLSLAGGIGAFASGQTGGLGLGGEGSGSTAVQNMAGKMMESVNSTGINVFNPEMASAAANAGSTPVPVEPAAGTIADIQTATVNPVDVSNPVQQVPLADTAATPGLDSNQRGIINTATTSGENPGGVYHDFKPASTPGEIKVADAAPNYSAGQTPAAPTGGGRSAITDPAAYTPPPEDKGIFGKSLAFIKENPDATKIGAQAIGTMASSAFAPDESGKISALIDRYGAETNILKTQNEILQYQQANMGKQVAMISANDPDLDAKVKAAAAQGIPVSFIPDFGSGGVKQTGNTAYGAGAASAAQTPTRPAAVYGKPVGA